jgi:thioester reductase-like protein
LGKQPQVAALRGWVLLDASKILTKMVVFPNLQFPRYSRNLSMCLAEEVTPVNDYTLLTGATGLLGRYLLRDLLMAGQRVVVIVRSSKKKSAASRIESLLQTWERQLGQPLPRPVCFEGDLSQEYLGLGDKQRQWLAEHCTHVLHSAAALKFEEEADGEPWRTNVTGTQHVLDLCQDANIQHMHYVSTAYVCGDREERIYEHQFDLGQGFRNAYEDSKLQAETLVRAADCFESLTVYRPAVIAGDSQTGYTNTYHGLFMYLQLMCVLARNTEPGPDGVRHTDLELHITGDEPRNVIPVDWTSAVICHLFTTPKSHGRTFHLAPSKRMTAREMIEAGYSYFNSTGVKFVGPAAELERPSGSMGASAYENSGMYRAYEASDPEFDTKNLQEFAGHLPCPDIDEAMLHKFMKYGEADRWGKRRQAPAKMEFCVSRFLERWLEESDVNPLGVASDVERLVGLDVLGPGGGQWTLAISEGRLLGVEPGLHVSQRAMWQVEVSEFAKFARAIDGTLVVSAPEDLTESVQGSALMNKLAAVVFADGVECL